MLESPKNLWYTDLMSIYRNTPYKEGNLTKQRRDEIQTAIPCRVYQKSASQLKMTVTAAEYNPSTMLACDNGVDIIPGDELHITRGGALGKTSTEVYYAGQPDNYFEPFGGVLPGMAHQQVPISSTQRAK
ncbi:MAG: hypothetical protein LBN00_06285 [Oscillospiraceae bacterium]|jgi:hypothetical protein|nr:hypothetical protein [Oscillospiraceae bacterium]